MGLLGCYSDFLILGHHHNGLEATAPEKTETKSTVYEQENG